MDLNRPLVFVGSAAEHAPILRRLGELNTYSNARYIPWTNLGVIPYGSYTLPSLCQRLTASDGAAFLSLSADKTWWRGKVTTAPRDNVIFEAGLAVGLLGLERTAIISDQDARLPSDLHGLTTIPYSTSGQIDNDVSDLHGRLERFFSNLAGSKSALGEIWSKKKYLIYFHSFDNPEKGEFEEIVNFNAVRAIGTLTDLFGRRGIQYSLHSSRLEELDVEENLVLLGSSASNRLSKQLSLRHGDVWSFHCDFDPNTMAQRCITNRRSGDRFESLFEGDRLAKDYGILTKIRNPFNEAQDIIVASGNYGFGTLAALRVILDHDGIASLPVNVRSQFQLVVEVPVLGRFTSGRPRVVSSVELS